MTTDPTTARLPEKLILTPHSMAFTTIAFTIDGTDGTRYIPDAGSMDTSDDDTTPPAVLTALVSRYNSHAALARAAEALRELVEAEDAANASAPHVPATTPQLWRAVAFVAARDALAALKEVE